MNSQFGDIDIETKTAVPCTSKRSPSVNFGVKRTCQRSFFQPKT